ncbi:unnamed protein product [Amoebophrya sp. A25]|nr:unnamed protein product [Amoebophrya sp. A25]|eukprot:GSA25T00026265001.1
MAPSREWQKFLPEPKQLEFTASLCSDKAGYMTQQQVRLFLRGMGLCIREAEFIKTIFNANGANLAKTDGADVSIASPDKGNERAITVSPLLSDDSQLPAMKYRKDVVCAWYKEHKEFYLQTDKTKTERALETLLPHIGGSAKNTVALPLLKHVLANLGDDKIKPTDFDAILGKELGAGDKPIAELLSGLVQVRAPVSYN